MSLLLSERRDGVLILTLNDTGRRNILSAELSGMLTEAVLAAGDDLRVKALIVTGAGSAFCAGARLNDLEAAAAGDDSAVQAVYRAFLTVADCPLPTIAAVNGPAVGAGLNLALACDMRVAVPDAPFDTRFLQIGLHPGGGHGWMLLRAVGWAMASRMLLGQQVLRGEAALAARLVEQLCAPEDLLATALAIAAPMAASPRDLLLRTKASLRHAACHDHAAAFAHETAEQAWSLGQPAFRELVEGLRAKIAER
ncbi:MAG: enoyl-CoA hydratase-related protein [Sphingobium sp.]|nr:enoyl-CoA hydratase-related protein [Sphingobium sp.]